MSAQPWHASHRQLLFPRGSAMNFATHPQHGLKYGCALSVLTKIVNLLNQRLCNFCCHLTRATAEPNANKAMLKEGPAAGPGIWGTSELEHGPLLTLSKGPAE